MAGYAETCVTFMSWQTLYHRIFAVTAAAVLWGYAIFSFGLGRVFLPLRYGHPVGEITPLWSDQRAWLSIDGAAGYMCMLSLLVVGVGMLILPPPADTQAQWRHQSTRESAAKVLLLTGAALLVLGIVFAWVSVGMVGGRPGGARALQALRQQQTLQRQFDAWKPLWGGLFFLLMAGGIIDLVLRRRRTQ